MSLLNIYNIFIGQDIVQVNDHALKSKSVWTVGELLRVFPTLPILKMSYNRQGFVIYTEKEAAQQLLAKRPG